MSDDLVQRLRAYDRNHVIAVGHGTIATEAADRIEAQEQEIARLKREPHLGCPVCIEFEELRSANARLREALRELFATQDAVDTFPLGSEARDEAWARVDRARMAARALSAERPNANGSHSEATLNDGEQR